MVRQPVIREPAIRRPGITSRRVRGAWVSRRRKDFGGGVFNRSIFPNLLPKPIHKTCNQGYNCAC